MKIALVHYSAKPVVGGVEVVIDAHRRLLAAAGHEVSVVARDGEPNVRLSATDPLPELAAALGDAETVMVHNVLSMPFDLRLTESIWALAQRWPEKRWINWVHDLAAMNPDYDYPWHQAPWRPLAKACPGFTHVTVSLHRARQFASLTGEEARVIPNGVEPATVLNLTDSIRLLVEKHRILQRDIVLVHPTRLLRRKNVEFGLEVIRELRRRGKDAVSLITAAYDPHNKKSSEYVAALRQKRKTLGLEDCALFLSERFGVAEADVASLYEVADALFFPSRQEGFGLPVLEAALHRIPVFAADVEPINALIRNGFHGFAPDASVAEVAEMIIRTLDRLSLRRARREVLESYAWSSVWSQHLAPLLVR